MHDTLALLECSGNDPGLAFDSLDIPQASGPYTLEFRMQSTAVGEGEVFWTIDTETSLPNGARVGFRPQHDDQWHEVKLKIVESKAIHAFRLDPCSGSGKVRIDGLKLLDVNGALLRSW